MARRLADASAAHASGTRDIGADQASGRGAAGVHNVSTAYNGIFRFRLQDFCGDADFHRLISATAGVRRAGALTGVRSAERERAAQCAAARTSSR